MALRCVAWVMEGRAAGRCGLLLPMRLPARMLGQDARFSLQGGMRTASR